MTSPKRARPVTQRHEEGRSHLASLLNWWLRQSDVTHEQLALISDWASGEEGLLSPSSVSHLRNRTRPRGPSVRNLEAFAAVNHAIWLWQTQGPQAAIKALGPHSGYRISTDVLDGATWLPKPTDDRLPLDYGDLSMLSVGLLRLPYLPDMVLSPQDVELLSSKLAALLNELAGSGTPAEGVQRVLDAYPIKEPARLRRLRDLLLGEMLTREELEDELMALAMTVSRLRGLPDGSYGPTELHAELAQDRRRS